MAPGPIAPCRGPSARAPATRLTLTLTLTLTPNPNPSPGLLPTLKADAVFLSPPWGGLHYDDRAGGDFDLSADLQPCCGFDLFDAACTAAC